MTHVNVDNRHDTEFSAQHALILHAYQTRDIDGLSLYYSRSYIVQY